MECLVVLIMWDLLLRLPPCNGHRLYTLCFFCADCVVPIVSFQMGSVWQACQFLAHCAKSLNPGPRPSLSAVSPARQSTAMLRWINNNNSCFAQSCTKVEAVVFSIYCFSSCSTSLRKVPFFYPGAPFLQIMNIAGYYMYPALCCSFSFLSSCQMHCLQCGHVIAKVVVNSTATERTLSLFGWCQTLAVFSSLDIDLRWNCLHGFEWNC